jgi:hypothetical protein
MQENVNGPAFLGIGAPRAGTTWIYRKLQAHPAVWVPPIKELHYFDSIDATIREDFATHRRSYRIRHHFLRRVRHYVAAPAYPLSSLVRSKLRLDPDWDFRFLFGEGGLDWYLSLFERQARRGLLTGEITPAYFMLDTATIELMRQKVPARKLLLMLRNPVEAAWSAVSKVARDRTISVDPDDPQQIKNVLDRDDIRKRYTYGDNLERWLSVYRRDEIFVGFFEDLTNDPAGLIRNVCEFLEIDNIYARQGAELRERINAATGTLGKLQPGIRAHLAACYRPQLEKLVRLLPDHAPPHEWLHGL